MEDTIDPDISSESVPQPPPPKKKKKKKKAKPSDSEAPASRVSINSKGLINIRPPKVPRKTKAPKEKLPEPEPEIVKPPTPPPPPPPPLPPQMKKSKKKKAKPVEEEPIEPPISHTSIDTEAAIPFHVVTDSSFAENKNIIICAIDEIALEGLDGITIEGLWTRMSIAVGHELPFSHDVENCIWNFVCQLGDITFHKLESPRPILKVFNRFDVREAESGYILDDVNAPPDLYPYVPVNDRDKGVIGSCASYHTRTDVSDEVRGLALDEVIEKYGNSLVLVGSQTLRHESLITDTTNPRMIINENQYYVLERIGRSRRIGEVTCGIHSLTSICKDAKTLFYYRKALYKNQLITKQPYCFKNANRMLSKGILFHIQRFYNERKSRKQIIIEQIVKMLKARPLYRMEYMELRRLLGDESWEKLGLGKLVKSNEFKQFVRTDVNLLYREVYPNAKESEWKRKVADKEKSVRCFELVNPNVNVNSYWREEEAKDSSSDDDCLGALSYNTPICKQSYDLIYNTGRNGVYLKELRSLIGVDFYTVRSITKILQKNKLVSCIMVDAGRQRYSKFLATCFNDDAVYETFLKNKDKPIPPKEPCDDETLDFIADVLEIDVNNLKQPEQREQPDDSMELDKPDLSGCHQTLREIRLRNIELDKMNKFKSKSEYVPEDHPKSRDKKLAQKIYSNEHNYISNDTTVNANILKRIIQIPLGFKIAPKGTIKGITATFKATPVLSLYNNQTSNNESNIDIKLKESLEKRYQKVITTRRVRKFSKPLKKIFITTPNVMARNYKSYIQTLKTIIDKMLNEVRENKEIPSELVSSDDDEHEDTNSLIVNLDDGNETKVEYNALDEVKTILINNFNNSKVLITNLTAHYDVPSGEEFKKRRRESISSVISTKRIKLEEDEEDEDVDVTPAPDYGVKMDAFMGPKPILVKDEIDEDNIITKVVISTNPADYGQSKRMTLSERVNLRMDFIKKAVEKHKIIPDLSKMLQLLTAAEKKDGYVVTCDRKSVFRIYGDLVRQGAIKMVKIIVKYEQVKRMKNIIVYPDVDIKTLVDSTIEQFKMSFLLYAKRKLGTEDKTDEVVDESGEVIKADGGEVRLEGDLTRPIKYKYSRTIGKTYGYYPKIAKIKVLHEYLYYLLYDYNGEVIPVEDANVFMKGAYEKSTDTLFKECSPLYHREVSWKMFIPPLPEHKNWPSGWLLICDSLLRLPLSVFIKIFNVTYVIPELTKHYLNHPIKKHFLVKNLPPDIRDAILNYRKYIFSIYEVFCFLSYLGLLQFGPQKYREKDQQFIFLNKNAIIYDTTSSEPGYHEITQKEYPKKSYTFHTMKELDEYWHDVYAISIKTRLGQRTSVIGKYISLQHIHSKTDMLNALKPHNQETVIARDIGYLPGDGLGACGVDSALWIHVKRNWVWLSQRSKQHSHSSLHPITGIRKKHMEDVKPIKFTEYLKQAVKKPQNSKVRRCNQTVNRKAAKKGVPQNSMVAKKKAVLRKVKPRKEMMSKKIRVDAIDKNILEKMGKTRATFCDEEDKLILLCKAVVDYLCRCYRRRTVVNSTIRDFIHKLLPYSRKTSSAYKRRFIQLNRSVNLHDKKEPVCFKLSSDFFTQKHFKRLKDTFSEFQEREQRYSELHMSLAFLYLAYYTYKRWKQSPSANVNEDEVKDYLIPSTIHKYNISSNLDDDESIYQDPIDEDTIVLDTIKGVIHSSLGCQNKSQEWPYQLLKVYQSFPEELLRKGLTTLREQQVISGKKATTKHSGGKEGTILMCGTTYHLSFGYTFKQITKYPSYIFNEAHDFFVGVYKHMDAIKIDGKSIESFEQGHGIGLSEVAAYRKLRYVFDLPDNIITLNPAVHNHKDLVEELALRYKILMSKRPQDNEEEEGGSEDPEVSKKLVSVLQNFIETQLHSETENIVDIEKVAELPVEDIGWNTDRRQKGLRISFLAYLLTKGLFPELDDDERLEKLNRHFLVRYPTCRFVLDDDRFGENDEMYRECHTKVLENGEKRIQQILKDCLITNSVPNDEAVLKQINAIGGLNKDKLIADQVLDFIYQKNILGATAKDLTLQFANKTENLSLDQILQALLDVGIVIRAGVCNFAFVHFSYRHDWSIYLDMAAHKNVGGSSIGYRIKVAPWIKIDGTIYTSTLLNWLNIVLSHCLSYPFVPLVNLCKRFCYIKPVDIYSLLEFLQDLTCLKMMTYHDNQEEDIFSEMQETIQAPTKITDNFDQIFIETDHLATIKFGAFLNKDNANPAAIFDD